MAGEPKGPACPYHQKELGLINGALHCPVSGCAYRQSIGAAASMPNHGLRSLQEVQAELAREEAAPQVTLAPPHAKPTADHVEVEHTAREKRTTRGRKKKPRFK